tara:strand:+ start:206 stop:523 length:318 start_codon:yes stop_codon:yes gene_type:complete
MADESIIARALCQLLEADMIAQGMDPKLASTLAGRACEVGVVRTGRAAKRGAKAVKRGAKKAVKGMDRALKEANEIARKKNGEFRKGFDQKKLMKKAHQLRRKYI